MIKIKNSNIQFKVFLGNKNKKTIFAKSINTAWKGYSLVLEIEEIAKNLLDSLEVGYSYKIVAKTGEKEFSVEDSLSEEEVRYFEKEYEVEDSKPSFSSIRNQNLITFYLPKVVEVERLEQGFICNAKKPIDLYVQELGLQNVELEYYPTQKGKSI